MLRNIASNSMLESYGDMDNFNAYRLDGRISDLKAAVEDCQARIVLRGFSLWGRQMQKYHQLLVESGVRNDYGETKCNWHRWDESWMTACLDAMLLPGLYSTPSGSGRPDLDRTARGDDE